MAHMSNDGALVRVDLNTNVCSHQNILIQERGRWLCGHLQMKSLKGTCDLVLTMKSLYIDSRYIYILIYVMDVMRTYISNFACFAYKHY